MKIKVVSIGKTNVHFVQQGVDEFVTRVSNYTKFEWIELPDVKHSTKLSKSELQKKECELLLPYLSNSPTTMLLDEHGKLYSSKQFAQLLEKHQLQSTQELTFIIGGAYGFSKELLAMNFPKFALSPMTFTHQMIRLIFAEQLYRAFTIIRNEKYHH